MSTFSDHDPQQEIPFSSGESNGGVVRVGNTVRRVMGRNSDRTHAMMHVLTTAGFTLTPKLLGIDESDREIISYIPGEIITSKSVSIEICNQAIAGLRMFHDILAATPLKEDQETVCHRDFAPWNVLVSDDQVIGIIDLDDAYPGTRLTDLTYACWTFLNLGNKTSMSATRKHIEGIAHLVSVYGEVDVTKFVPTLLKEQSRILRYRKGRVTATKDVAEKAIRLQRVEKVTRQMQWVREHSSAINQALGI